MSIKSYKKFLLEKVQYRDNMAYFRCTTNFMYILQPLINSSKVAKILMDLAAPIHRENLIENPADFLDIVFTDENYGYISYLKEKYSNDLVNSWTSPKRIAQKATKALKEFYKPEYIEKHLTNADFELFFNLINAQKDSLKIVEFRGEDVLRAYNYTHELVKSGFGSSCANFNQKEINGSFSKEPKKEHFDVYIKNPENFGVAVLMEKDAIIGRISFQQGPNLLTTETYKKGEIGTVMNTYHGVSGPSHIKIINYLKDKYNAKPRGFGFAINMETRFAQYPPFDSMYVCFQHNILTDGVNTQIRNQLCKEYNVSTMIFNSTYGAECPKKLVEQRILEETPQKTTANPPMKTVTIGDVHGRNDWKKAVYQMDDDDNPTACLLGNGIDMAIFLGDYVDSFDKSSLDILTNLKEIVQLKKDYPNNVILLLGNHDVAYIRQDFRISGFRFDMMHDLHELFQKNRDLFQMAYQHENVLWTHAGVHKGWWRMYIKPVITGKKKERFSDMLSDCKNEADFLNLMYAFEYDPLYLVSFYRGGISTVGGPFWADRKEVYSKPLEGFHQVVGHTPVDDIKEFENKKLNTKVTFCDCSDKGKFYYSQF